MWAIPLVWLGSGLGPWLLADPGTHTLGASGLTHGLMFMIFMLGLLRRDRAAIAAGMIAFLFYGGMVLTILPRETGVSWQAHLGGAVAGLIATFLFRRLDPELPRKRLRRSRKRKPSRVATTNSNCLRRAKSRCCGCGRSNQKRSSAAWCCTSPVARRKGHHARRSGARL